jgi:ABC-type polysaccharide/polyol phosphate transport system ATPase subunit
MPIVQPPVAPTPPTVLLEAEGLGKRFDIYPNDRSRFFELVGNRTHHVEHWALRGLGFRVERGRAFGVIGSNGAGKSTLLRLLAGITEPTEGSLGVYGRMATLLDLGVGFHDTFTGRENIQLTCSLLGLDPALIQERIPEIIRFAELGDFIDYPVRTYSTGMNLRLGFAVAMHVDADILLIDEVLAVGDQYFQRKCVRRIEQAVRDGATLVLVSHDLHAVRSLCDEVLWLDRGRPRAIGPPREVIERYLELDRVRVAPTLPDAPPRPTLRPIPGGTERVISLPASRVSEEDPALRDTLEVACALEDPAALFDEAPGDAPRRTEGDRMLVAGTGEARIVRVQLLDAQGHERERFRSGESLVVAVTFRTTEPLERPIFGVALFRNDGVYVFGPNTRFDGVLEGTYHGVYTFFVHYPALPLLAGTYRVSVAIFDAGHVTPHVWHNQLYTFEVSQDIEDHGIVRIPHRWGLLTWHDAQAAPKRGSP